MREVLSSAAEAELGALFHKGKQACPLCIALEELGHPQLTTPMATDNNTASGIVTDTVKQKRLKVIDMHFYWIREDNLFFPQGTWGVSVTSRFAFPGPHNMYCTPSVPK